MLSPVDLRVLIPHPCELFDDEGVRATLVTPQGEHHLRSTLLGRFNLGTVRALSLLEGRIVETMLGVRMPRRPPYPSNAGKSFWQRVGAFFTDVHTWTTLFYMVLMLPLGILYFTLTVTFLSISLAFIATPVLKALSVADVISLQCGYPYWLCDNNYWPLAVLTCIAGVFMLFATLHMVRGMGKLHGAMAKSLLVRIVGEDA